MTNPPVRLLPTIPVNSPADRMLRDSLALLREQGDEPQRELIDDILAGRRNVRELADSGWFQKRLAARLQAESRFLAEVGQEVRDAEQAGVDPIAFADQFRTPVEDDDERQ